MRKSEEDLKAIMNLLWEWTQEHGAPDANMSIYNTGRAFAYSLMPDRDGYENWVSEYYCPTKENEPAGGNRTGSGS